MIYLNIPWCVYITIQINLDQWLKQYNITNLYQHYNMSLVHFNK